MQAPARGHLPCVCSVAPRPCGVQCGSRSPACRPAPPLLKVTLQAPPRGPGPGRPQRSGRAAVCDEFPSEGLASDFVKFHFCNKPASLTYAYELLHLSRTPQIDKFTNEKNNNFFGQNPSHFWFRNAVAAVGAASVKGERGGERLGCRPGLAGVVSGSPHAALGPLVASGPRCRRHLVSCSPPGVASTGPPSRG